MKKFNLQLFAEEVDQTTIAGTAATTAEVTTATTETTMTDAAAIEAITSTTTTIDGTDLSTLTADQLLALSEEEWQEFYTVVKTALAAKATEKKAALKVKITAATEYVKNYVLPAVKYTAGAAVLLKVFGVI